MYGTLGEVTVIVSNLLGRLKVNVIYPRNKSISLITETNITSTIYDYMHGQVCFSSLIRNVKKGIEKNCVPGSVTYLLCS